ncbi:molybdenum cofactor guanylyltransferase MobA [Pseudomonas sp. HMWF032]|uniref:molybdenum cofactor guanylyltransferase MobA n=1 Tax=unclassified Pseudomonas TaxID=196821 RepID=UPI000D39FA1F|nr:MULTISPECIES: molybdenum cofactor guanylyltransferase MobA [unclassified Pseudomonas]PTS83525.1 molybdenum cofactor guanylyltransferase MobA [Pseudomonas sp. HMWF032]PTT84115.1 molybdenum cofactor guanylyltransferase MobA [Pseudomonas sp. HMWF010]WAC44757.1 molybdenum cofactor guanylyltransferase MobA [Pseudomonas sp. SL4(2022)]
MPAPDNLPGCSVLLLAGGRGQRMGGADKGLLDWQGRPLIAWLHERVRPLTDDLLISCNRNAERYAPFADRLVSDEAADYQGPLAGIRAGLRVARHANLLILPCDAPQLDNALLQALLSQAGERAVVIRQGEFLEPLFSIIPCTLRADLERAWQAGERSPQRWLRSLAPLTIDCLPGDQRLANLNTPELLAAADQPPPGNLAGKVSSHAG